jgi:hypothetical protein
VEAQHEARSNEQINLIETKNYNSCSDKIKHYGVLHNNVFTSP